jgi:DNA-binding FrmR family transcriptional regulator
LPLLKRLLLLTIYKASCEKAKQQEDVTGSRRQRHWGIVAWACIGLLISVRPDLIVGMVITLMNADAARGYTLRLVPNTAQPFRDPPKPTQIRKLNVFHRYHTWYSIYSISMSHTIEDKQKLLLRAKRIQGQVEALVRALTEERDCSDVLQLMSAARGAMNSLMAELLEGHIRSHVLNGKQKPTSAQVLAADEVIDMVKSYLR